MSPSQHSTLTINLPGQPARQVELDNDSYTIGRSPGCDIIIATPVISRKHGLLERKGGNWVYTDLNSQNGSYSNGQGIQQVVLRDGMRLQLGKEAGRSVTLIFQLATQAEEPLSNQTIIAGPSLPPIREENPDPNVTRLSERNCPRCHVSLQPDAKLCPNCGFNIATPQPVKLPETVIFAAAPDVVPEAVPEFVIRLVGGNVQKYELSKSVMRLGRAPDNNIVINSPLVSSHHLQVETLAGRVSITDLNSTNGTQVNGVRIAINQPIPLQVGDVIRVGDLTGNSLQITFGEAKGGVRTKAMGKLDLGKLATQPSVLIGRATSCDLCIPHPSVSKHHAMILRQRDNILIQDLGSTNGTFVNGVRITKINLSDGDEIRIGPFHLLYDGRLQNLAGSRHMGHRLDAVRLIRQVSGGATILNDVSVSIQSSEFVALVGGSGAGKSTLMKALNGYEPATKGQMLIDGEDLYGRLDILRTEMGYVPQDDIIHRELPVRLALWYAAKLRLPDASSSEIEQSIEDSLEAVEMSEHQNKRVKNLSGGQRKRVSIASELLAQPTLFFLDEPTSGLDPGLEKKMMYDLSRLADQGRTIVLVTHATSNIEQCDYVAFMSEGRLAYYGPPREAISFFGAQDFADIYQKLSQNIDPDKGIPAPPELQSDYQRHLSATIPQPGANPNAASRQTGGSPGKISAGLLWAEHFRRSPLYQKYVSARQANVGAGRQSRISPGAKPIKSRGGSFLGQTWILARRNFDLIRHDIRTLLVLLVMLPLIGLLFGASTGGQDWWLTGKGWEDPVTENRFVINSPADADKAMKDEIKGKPKDTTRQYTPFQDASTLVAMLALALTQGGTFAASYEIVKERPIFQRERAVNLSVWAYVLSKVAVLSLFALFQVAGALLLLSFFVDLNVVGVIFADFSILEIFISLYLAIMASIALGLLISSLVPSTDVVLYVILAQLFLQIVLTGALFPIDANLASYATPGYWATDAISSIVDLPTLDKNGRSCIVIEAEVPDMNTGTVNKEIRYECSSAKSDQSNLKYYNHEAGHMIRAWFALGAQLVMFTLLTIIVQSRKKSGRN